MSVITVTPCAIEAKTLNHTAVTDTELMFHIENFREKKNHSNCQAREETAPVLEAFQVDQATGPKLSKQPLHPQLGAEESFRGNELYVRPRLGVLSLTLNPVILLSH